MSIRWWAKALSLGQLHDVQNKIKTSKKALVGSIYLLWQQEECEVEIKIICKDVMTSAWSLLIFQRRPEFWRASGPRGQLSSTTTRVRPQQTPPSSPCPEMALMMWDFPNFGHFLPVPNSLPLSLYPCLFVFMHFYLQLYHHVRYLSTWLYK